MIFQQEFGALIGAAVLLLLKKARDKLPGEGSHSWSVAGRWAVGWEGKGREEQVGISGEEQELWRWRRRKQS